VPWRSVAARSRTPCRAGDPAMSPGNDRRPPARPSRPALECWSQRRSPRGPTQPPRERFVCGSPRSYLLSAIENLLLRYGCRCISQAKANLALRLSSGPGFWFHERISPLTRPRSSSKAIIDSWSKRHHRVYAPGRVVSASGAAKRRASCRTGHPSQNTQGSRRGAGTLDQVGHAQVAPGVGLEPTTERLTVACSTN
jgi:hypothetical protein